MVHPIRQGRASHVEAAICIAAHVAALCLSYHLNVLAGTPTAIIGYARASTREQEAGLQADYSSTASIPGAIDIIGMPGIRPDGQMSGNDATIDDIPPGFTHERKPRC